ncbi:MAG: hypothetical protein A3B11_00575 [Candidatus Taylorbacteria bacterium RIFCSPLOWO2_01_FULL_44_26]|uniref:Uncharacterized protein n=2 Tax=Candidatus Tayloriibacteriota TaxID=1817919 RepID=A0A1G2MNT7_9BACT|nr:MAG: hypothetical protein A3D50_00490 [Candidatus Taylorbacteria bacterium RIFCSPHIGHO2_02_FULL_44_12]OHA31179.1 MAG: hypothetical protein A3B11_00575 [Candidatus Taylorbacteria bacterium RIFCSPLOWO2_01_FULL_44_26]
MPPQKKKIGKIKWLLLYSFTGVVDVLQFLADLTGIGILASEAAEPFIGGILIVMFELFGISVITKPKRLVSLLCLAGADALTGGIAPFWIVDVWYVQSDVKKEETEYEQQTQQEMFIQSSIGTPANIDGQRIPPIINSTNNQPLNQNGIRMPRRNIAPLQSAIQKTGNAQ